MLVHISARMENECIITTHAKVINLLNRNNLSSKSVLIEEMTAMNTN